MAGGRAGAAQAARERTAAARVGIGVGVGGGGGGGGARLREVQYPVPQRLVVPRPRHAPQEAPHLPTAGSAP